MHGSQLHSFKWAQHAMMIGCALAISSAKAASLPSDDLPIVLAQAAAAPSPDKIRAQSQRMKEFRALLADPDSNIRLAALDEMLKSNEPAMRELAFDAGFASADQNMRALALRARVLSMNTFVIDLQNTAKMDDDSWQKLVAANRPHLTFTITKSDPQTGNLELTSRSGEPAPAGLPGKNSASAAILGSCFVYVWETGASCPEPLRLAG